MLAALGALLLATTSLLLSTILFIYIRFLRPPVEPRGIPSIPFYITLLALFRDVDQEDIFKKHIRDPLLKHGAVKIFFASQWNILVQRPELLAQMFKEEDDFQKSGNHKKIPGSVLASYLGENIISSHGEIWRSFRGIMQPGLQEGWSADVLFENAERLGENLVKEIREGAGKKVIIVREHAQRLTIANIARVMLGVDFGTMESKSSPVSQLQSLIKSQIFQPIYMNFPFLDTIGLPNRERARASASIFTDFIVDAVRKECADYKTRETDQSCQKSRSELSQRLVDARSNGEITELQLRNNLTITFVAGQENPELALVSTLYLLAKSPKYQDLILNEISALSSDGPPTSEELAKLPVLSSTILESLRLLPPIGQLINRRASKPLYLGAGLSSDPIFIPEGTYLGYNSYATNRDPSVWGSDSDGFRPERWGSSTEAIQKEFRRRKAKAEFISFHGGRRACLGEKFALAQLRITVWSLVRILRWELDPEWVEKMTPAGPLSPRGLRLVFRER